MGAFPAQAEGHAFRIPVNLLKGRKYVRVQHSGLDLLRVNPGRDCRLCRHQRHAQEQGIKEFVNAVITGGSRP